MLSFLHTHENASVELPATLHRWELSGPGLNNLNDTVHTIPELGPNELLVRHDACGICFSDIKIIKQGGSHPRLRDRDLQVHPVVMGHEISLTVVQVGLNLLERFRVGERYTVQADIYYNGINQSYGYTLDGGLSDYGVITKEVFDGDAGSYLIPVKSQTGYAEAALVEPWACVVAAYDYPRYRSGIKDAGSLLIIYVDSNLVGDEIIPLFYDNHQPSKSLVIDDLASVNISNLIAEETGGCGFDDILVLGNATGEQLSKATLALGDGGVLVTISQNLNKDRVMVDIGKIHYEGHQFIGGDSLSEARAAYSKNNRKDLLPGGKVLFLGAGGPMGQMHLQRTVLMDNPPRMVVATDTNLERLNRLRDRFSDALSAKSIEFIALNPSDESDLNAFGEFDDIVSLIPSSLIVEETLPLLAPMGVYNIFAGVPRGTFANLDLHRITGLDQRIIGTSGSGIEDLRKTLSLVESKVLSTNASVAAIGGLDAVPAGMAAVMNGDFPGKTVIFPNIRNLQLTPLSSLGHTYPTVAERLENGCYWTVEAEHELFKLFSSE